MEPIKTNPTQPAPALAPTRPNRTVFKLVVGLVVVAALVGGGVWWAHHEAVRQEALKKLHEEQDSEAFAHEATIQITAAGFLPSKITVARDTRIYFENKDKSVHSLVTDDATAKAEPDLGKNEEMSVVQEIAPAGGHAYSFHHAGTFRAHDGHNPTANIEIEVK